MNQSAHTWTLVERAVGRNKPMYHLRSAREYLRQLDFLKGDAALAEWSQQKKEKQALRVQVSISVAPHSFVLTIHYSLPNQTARSYVRALVYPLGVPVLQSPSGVIYMGARAHNMAQRSAHGSVAGQAPGAFRVLLIWLSIHSMMWT